ncbi:MAG: oxidoreductase [Acidobacteria bacterium]|nr:oxidoreductase [Acidobacteriota bacterium]
MSLLDMDERLLDLASLIDLVYSPIMDVKEFPEGVDITLVEGAVANEDNARMLRLVRERTDVLVAFGDCAVAGNVTALRNPIANPLPVLQRSYGPDPSRMPGLHTPDAEVPPLVTKVENLRALVRVDYYLPGCPPSADLIFFVLSELVAGRTLNLQSRATLG